MTEPNPGIAMQRPLERVSDRPVSGRSKPRKTPVAAPEPAMPRRAAADFTIPGTKAGERLRPPHELDKPEAECL